jgi:hypothetical protein
VKLSKLRERWRGNAEVAGISAETVEELDVGEFRRGLT